MDHYHRKKDYKKNSLIGTARQGAHQRLTKGLRSERERQSGVKRQLVCRELGISEIAPSELQIGESANNLGKVCVSLQSVSQPLTLQSLPSYTPEGLQLLWDILETEELERNLQSVQSIISCSFNESIVDSYVQLGLIGHLRGLLELLICLKISSPPPPREQMVVSLLNRLLWCLSSISSCDGQESGVVESGCIPLLHSLLSSPQALRTRQLTAWCLTNVAEKSPKAAAGLKWIDGGEEKGGETQNVAPFLDTSIELLRDAVRLIANESEKREGSEYNLATQKIEDVNKLLDREELVEPVGGLLGLLRMSLSLIRNLSHFKDWVILHHYIYESSLLELLGDIVTTLSPEGNGGAVLQLSPNHDIRVCLSEALWCMVDAFDGYSRQRSPPSLLLSFNAQLLESCSDFISQSLLLQRTTPLPEASISSESTIPSSGSFEVDPSSIKGELFLMDPEVANKLSSFASDLLLPALSVLRFFALFDIGQHVVSPSSSDSSPPDHPVLDLITNSRRFIHPPPFPPDSSSLPSSVSSLVLCLRSFHISVRHEAASILALAAQGSSAHTAFVLPFVPLLAQLLINPEIRNVKQEAAYAILQTSFRHSAVNLSAVLDFSVPPPLSLSPSPSYNFEEDVHLVDSDCSICGKRSVMDALLSLLNRFQVDIELINIALDFVEELLKSRPSMLGILYHHGVIDIIESVQHLDDKLFHRVVGIVEKYYDDYQEDDVVS